jgi:hypothetical protein
MAKAELTIILPGLARVLDQQINSSVIPEYLSRIIAKSQLHHDPTGLTRLLFNHFSQTQIKGSDLPVANLLSASTSVLCADPCYLHPDRDRLLLFTQSMALTVEESTALIAEIQPLLDEFGGELVCHTPDNWLLNLQIMPDLTFNALAEVNGKAVDDFLPKGTDQQNWIRLWNEIQMQLYDSEVNQQRISEGKLPINSIWFWGAGTFIANKKSWQQVQGQLPLLNDLAQHSAISLNNNPDWSIASLFSGKHLWVLDEIDIESNWQQQLQQVDQQILQPLWQNLRMAKMTSIELQIPNRGSYLITPTDCWKFWKS